jgi:hypothetical protein
MVYAVIIVNICCVILLHLLAEDPVKAVENWLDRKLGCDLHSHIVVDGLTGIEIFIFGVLSVLCRHSKELHTTKKGDLILLSHGVNLFCI